MRRGGAVRERGSRTRWRERGEVLLEAAVALPLIGVVVFGLGQQFAVSSAKLEHIKIATEVALGPQEPGLVFDSSTTEFAQLSDGSNPTLQTFLNTIGEFARQRAEDATSVYVALGYLRIDRTTGHATGQTKPRTVEGYRGSAAAACDDSMADALSAYADSQLTSMLAYSAVPTPAPTPTPGRGPAPAQAPAPATGGVSVGAKLYDVRIGASRYQGYVDYMPFIFMLVCSEPPVGGVLSPPTSTFTLVPRRLVG
ncbi:MAG: hypothetical protein RL417_1654 [Pseudomonadota bacterium]|jgi:hypothetical protein